MAPSKESRAKQVFRSPIQTHQYTQLCNTTSSNTTMELVDNQNNQGNHSSEMQEVQGKLNALEGNVT